VVEDAGMSVELRCVDPTHEDQGEKFKLEWRS